MDSGGCESGIEGGTIEEEKAVTALSPIDFKMPMDAETKALLKPDEPLQGTEREPLSEENKVEEAQTVVDQIDFKNGENVLSIKFSKKHNRMFRIQIILNDGTEIRPVTYTGSSSAYNFWHLLKGALKK